MNFRKWLENWGDDDGPESMYAAQSASAARLKELVSLYNQQTGSKMSVAQKGEGYEDQRDSDHFALFINGQEITEGDLDELYVRVRQICKEEGLL